MAEDEARGIHEQLRDVDVADLVLSSASTIAMLALAKLDAGEVEQARTGIEALQALIPVLDGKTDAETIRGLQSALSSLQLAYADAVAGPDVPPG